MEPTTVIGRDHEQESLLAALNDQDKPIVLASGFGGAGKSTLAKVITWGCVERKTPFEFIAWVDMRQYDQGGQVKAITFGNVLDSIAKAANPASEILSMADLEIKAARVRELIEAKRSLLVLDNYESLLASPADEEMVARFINSLPIGRSAETHGPFIRVLITTRVVSPTLSRLPIFNKRLMSLPADDSVKMMRLQPGAPRLTNRQWRRVWELLHGLPKYMQTAVQQLREMTFADWEKQVTQIQWPPGKPDDFFFDLFDFSWRNPAIVSEDLKRVLLAMTYFVGHARSDDLCKVSGIGPHRFRDALSVSYKASYIDVIRKRPGREYYSVHPLTHAYCRAALNSEELKEFREESGARFVHCFVELAKECKQEKAMDALDDESENVVAAARVAAQLELWTDLIGLRAQVGDFFRIRGHWADYKEIIELAIKACSALGEGKEELRTECMVYDLAWFYLRIEDVKTARRILTEGLKLFEKKGHQPGMALALRHLGKAALLDGLDARYMPKESAQQHFARAERYYKQSLSIQRRLQRKGEGQQLSVADMKLDLGRLYWLQGIKCEQDGRCRGDSRLLAKALRKYAKAKDVSEQARQEYVRMSLREDIATARSSKAWGNLGNATKETALHMASSGRWVRAAKYAQAAEECYQQNLSLGRRIAKKDEIAHALAGLAEVHVFMTKRRHPFTQTAEKRDLLTKARKEIRMAHRLYEDLAGPRQQTGEESKVTNRKTRDEIRTAQFLHHVERLLGAMDTPVTT